MKRCYKCGEPWEGEGVLTFKAVCEKCFAYLHCCKNCRLHDPLVNNECLSRTTESVPEREGPNFCEEFEFIEEKGTSREPSHDDGQKKWDDLFGGM